MVGSGDAVLPEDQGAKIILGAACELGTGSESP